MIADQEQGMMGNGVHIVAEMECAKLLILNGPRYPARNPNPIYRGTFRMHPRYFENLPESHEANRLFHWFLEEGGELGVVNDEPKARRLCAVCNTYDASYSYEVVEVVEGNAKPLIGREFLGFDISQAYNNSLLWSGLNTLVPGEPDLPTRVLANTLFRLFAEKLNRAGLFSDFDTAARCRASLIALQLLEPNIIEGITLEKFAVVGLFQL
jgi:hypothetical protein